MISDPKDTLAAMERMKAAYRNAWKGPEAAQTAVQAARPVNSAPTVARADAASESMYEPMERMKAAYRNAWKEPEAAQPAAAQEPAWTVEKARAKELRQCMTPDQVRAWTGQTAAAPLPAAPPPAPAPRATPDPSRSRYAWRTT